MLSRSKTVMTSASKVLGEVVHSLRDLSKKKSKKKENEARKPNLVMKQQEIDLMIMLERVKEASARKSKN